MENGRRTMRAVFDLKSESQMVPAIEPLMLELDAEIELTPVMTAGELAEGVKAALG